MSGSYLFINYIIKCCLPTIHLQFKYKCVCVCVCMRVLTDDCKLYSAPLLPRNNRTFDNTRTQWICSLQLLCVRSYHCLRLCPCLCTYSRCTTCSGVVFLIFFFFCFLVSFLLIFFVTLFFRSKYYSSTNMYVSSRSTMDKRKEREKIMDLCGIWFWLVVLEI